MTDDLGEPRLRDEIDKNFVGQRLEDVRLEVETERVWLIFENGQCLMFKAHYDDSTNLWTTCRPRN